MKNFFRSIRTLFRAMPHFLLFEFLYKLILIAAGAPILALLLKLTMKLSGISYIYDESLMAYLHHPVTIVFVVLMLFAAGFFAFVELSALAACFYCYGIGESITVGGMLRTGLKGFKKAFRGLGILEFTGFMLMMPFVEFTLSSGVFMAPVMPVLRRIFGSISGSLAVTCYIVLQALLIFVIVSRSYSLHYLVLTDKSFPECIKKSREKIYKRKLHTTMHFLLWTLFVIAATALVTFGISFFILLCIKGFSRPDKAFRSSLYVLKYALKVFTAVSAFFSAPAVMCWLTGRFTADIKAEEELIVPDKNRVKMNKRKKAALIIFLTAGAVFLDFGYIRSVYKGNFRFAAGFLTTAQVTAHRGYSSAAPENTSYAFAAAMESGADYIELDVQLTADGELVVFHDDDLDRTTDGSGRLADHTYAELQQLSAGSWYSKSGEFDDAKIMRLSEVFELVGKKMLYNIEIKDTSKAMTAAEETVRLLNEYGLRDSCYISSFSYSVLRHVKELDPKIKTALIANMAASTSYAMLDHIDAVSMNYIFVNQSVVNSAHRNGKLIFVWTVDRRDDIEQMIVLGVDNIITDHPERAVEEVYSESLGENVIRILEKIFIR